MARHCLTDQQWTLIELTDQQWTLIEDAFPKPAATGRPPVNPRDMIDAIFRRLRTGSPWRDLPEEFGPWKTVDNHFDKWNSDGTLDEIKRRLLQNVVDGEGVDEELWCVDGTVVRAARCAGGGGKKGIPRNRTITHEDVPEAVFPRKSTGSAMPMGARFTSNFPQVRLTKTPVWSTCSTALTTK